MWYHHCSMIFWLQISENAFVHVMYVPCSSSSSTMTSKYWLIASKTQALSSIWTDFFGLVGAGRSTELCCSDLQIESPPKVILGVSNMFWIAERFSSKDLRSTSLTPNNHWYQSFFLERLNAELVFDAVSVLIFFWYNKMLGSISVI